MPSGLRNAARLRIRVAMRTPGFDGSRKCASRIGCGCWGGPGREALSQKDNPWKGRLGSLCTFAVCRGARPDLGGMCMLVGDLLVGPERTGGECHTAAFRNGRANQDAPETWHLAWVGPASGCLALARSTRDQRALKSIYFRPRHHNTMPLVRPRLGETVLRRSGFLAQTQLDWDQVC
jgi:hypothetical protein